MPQEISFLHAADLHLDSPFSGLTQVPEHIFHDIQQSTFTALKNLVQAAIDREVDFVLITGDLFDNEKQSLKAQIHLRNAFQDLKNNGIKVYMSYGNHDYMKGNVHPITYPDNVFVFPGETVSHFIYEKNAEQCAAIYGFSYENRAVLGNKTTEYHKIDSRIPYHIAMLHGSVSSNTEHDVYAPFHISDLTNKDFDYWALGHIHQRQTLQTEPPIIYPGNTQGRNRKEAGEKGCYYIRLSSTNTDMTFIGLEAMQFHNITVNVSDCVEIHQVELKLQHAIHTTVTSTVPVLIHLHVTGDSEELYHWYKEKYLDEMMDLLNESLIHQPNWRYVFRYTVEKQHIPMENELLYGEHFAGELMRHFRDVSIHPFLTDLFQHRKARKYIEVLSEKEEKAIKNDAKQLLIKELLKNRGG